MALRLGADAELLVITYLRAHSDVQAALGGQYVSSALPAEPSWPWVTVQRIGGAGFGPRGWLDVARLQVDAWADTKQNARSAAANILAALWDLPGVHTEGVVTGVEQDLGFRWEPDPETNQPRYLFGVAVYLHPLHQ